MDEPVTPIILALMHAATVVEEAKEAVVQCYVAQGPYALEHGRKGEALDTQNKRLMHLRAVLDSLAEEGQRLQKEALGNGGADVRDVS